MARAAVGGSAPGRVLCRRTGEGARHGRREPPARPAHGPAQRDPNIICRASQRLHRPECLQGRHAEAAGRTRPRQGPSEAAREEIGGSDHRPAVGGALPLDAPQGVGHLTTARERAHQRVGIPQTEVQPLAGDRVQGLRRIADAHDPPVGQRAFGIEPERKCFSGDTDAMRPTSCANSVFSTSRRWWSSSSATGSSSLPTHHTSAARPPGAAAGRPGRGG